MKFYLGVGHSISQRLGTCALVSTAIGAFGQGVKFRATGDTGALGWSVFVGFGAFYFLFRLAGK